MTIQISKSLFQRIADTLTDLHKFQPCIGPSSKTPCYICDLLEELHQIYKTDKELSANDI